MDNTRPSDATVYVAIGSYTEPYGPFRARGGGITLLAFDPRSGKADIVDALAVGPNPAYLRWHGSDIIHAVLEANDERAAIVTLRVDQVAGRLRALDRSPVRGLIPCHLDVDPSGRWLATACYGDGLVAIHKLKNDSPDEAQTAVYHRGRSVHPERQTTAHPHCVRFSQDGRWLIVPDLGTDEIVRYPFDVSSGDLAAPHRSKVPAGSGPRLAFFSADGRHLVCVYELASEVATFAWVDGELEAIERCATTQIRPNTAAGFRWHPSGRLFGVSNRGADTIALFRFEPESGIATPSALASSGGVKPRDFDFSPCGRWLLAANQDSDSVVVVALDEAEQIVPTERRVTIASPSCVRFSNG